MPPFASHETVLVVKPHPLSSLLELVYTTNALFSICSKGEYVPGRQVIYVKAGARLTKKIRYIKRGRVRAVNIRGIKSPGVILDKKDSQYVHPDDWLIYNHRLSTQIAKRLEKMDSGVENHLNQLDLLRTRFEIDHRNQIDTLRQIINMQLACIVVLITTIAVYWIY